MTQQKSFCGEQDIQAGFTEQAKNFPPGFMDAFTIKNRVVKGECAYIVWEALPWVELGTDTLIIRDGIIKQQTTASKAADSPSSM